jgi:hypothetical protein
MNQNRSFVWKTEIENTFEGKKREPFLVLGRIWPNPFPHSSLARPNRAQPTSSHRRLPLVGKQLPGSALAVDPSEEMLAAARRPTRG